jgi:Zn-dependent protease with chaperone function
VVAGDPLLLLKMRYSREMEAAADDYAVLRMRQLGLPIAPLADLYDDLAQSVWREERDIPAWMAVKFNYLYSHPPSAERNARFRSARPPAAP